MYHPKCGENWGKIPLSFKATFQRGPKKKLKKIFPKMYYQPSPNKITICQSVNQTRNLSKTNNIRWSNKE